MYLFSLFVIAFKVWGSRARELYSIVAIVLGRYPYLVHQRQIPPARYLDICIGYYYISRWYMGYRWDRYYIMYLRLCNIVSVSMILFYFLCWGVWEVPGIYSRYLVGIYSIRYTCMKAYTKRITIKFIL